MIFSVPYSKQGHHNKSQVWYSPKKNVASSGIFAHPQSEYKIYVIKEVSLFAFDVRKSQKLPRTCCHLYPLSLVNEIFVLLNVSRCAVLWPLISQIFS